MFIGSELYSNRLKYYVGAFALLFFVASPPGNNLFDLYAEELSFNTIQRNASSASSRKTIPRKILCIFGSDPAETEEDAVFPGDTLTLGMYQATLERMGYEVYYHDIMTGVPKGWDERDFCGIIIEETLTVPKDTESELSNWLSLRIKDNVKMLFLSTGGLDQELSKDQVFRALGIKLIGTVPKEPGEVTLLKADPELTGFETKAVPIARSFLAIQAPDNADPVISLSMKSKQGAIRYDPVFIADWGGCLLSPYGTYPVSSEISRLHIDPLKFLSRIWPADDFPVPDVNTKQGLRIFYSHIDGDGFVSVAHFPERPYCCEVMHDEVLKDLPFPVTVSIVEAEVRGHMLSQKNPKVERFEKVAAQIFKLPHIQAASHSYSHPYVWNDKDTAYFGQYDTLNLALKLTARYPNIVLEREIGGSLSYIEKSLSHAGNPPAIFLWSGNCRPSIEALRLVREAGLENMNGGNTILSKRFPGSAAVAPKLVAIEDEMQIHASNQNEFYYTEGWKGPYFNGFKKVIETFELTETPHRLKPVNVYYHFYSAERSDALAALQDIYKWCETQELHLMDTRAYADLVRDSFHTKIERLSKLSWKVKNKGHLQTYKIPTDKGYPDLANSKGVIGFNSHQGYWYVSTDGSGQNVITLSEQPVSHPHLISSTEPIKVNKLTGSELTLTNQSDLRTSDVTIGGLEGREWILSVNDQLKKLKGDQTNVLVHLSASQSVTIRATTSEQ